MDDPLRLLRTIRFANRFEFTIHPDIFEAAKDPEIKVSFSSLILILIVIFSSESN
jgi:tRNA nucleotidyltransferase/poly(A) polymerase